MKIITNWFKRTKKIIVETLSVKEQKRIEQGLEYLKDDGVSFSIDGEKQELCFEMREYRKTYVDRIILHREYLYYHDSGMASLNIGVVPVVIVNTRKNLL